MPSLPAMLSRGLSLLHRQLAEVELSSDPDNLPPRSRLFLVVPKQADPQQIQVSVRGWGFWGGVEEGGSGLSLCGSLEANS